ncbi:hypothetical protein [Chryseobacterium sp. 5_R23647]|uniref:hypothetical protein n=1 Tax=Chryseobacterium sp. 5_R23647 TaxID=2258964 RepID=UPI000E24A718|nr:hypothetical protein [Chryseobacterium sp. 5_R23647]REC40036.1 hypothetical protein DRF69_20345 [Chryseobacterium sp. 5_R23647]
MKTFIKYDYYTQMFVALSFIILLITDIAVFEKGYSWLGYFVVATFHTVSFLIKMFSKDYSKSTEFKIYSFISLTILISLLFIMIFDDIDWVTNFIGFILMFGIPLTPILAICYLIIVYKDYHGLVQNS